MTPTVESKRESSADSKELQWLALSRVPGWTTTTSLIKTGTDIGELLKAPSGALIRDFGLSDKLARGMADALKASSFQIEKRLLQESPEIHLYCPETRAYPLQLNEINNPSSVLYWKGTERIADRPCLAFVGSRTLTAYGKKQTKRIIHELAQVNLDLVIVSGLARGIDTVAHESALEAGLNTVAVIAGGLKHIYPLENFDLTRKIEKQGAVVSEFPLAIKPATRNFPIRNCVISGLSQGVVFTEARLKRGAHITEAFALQQNRGVFALPGRVDSEASAGCNLLISRQHAKLIRNANDILEEIHPGFGRPGQPKLPLDQPERIFKMGEFSPVEQQVLLCLEEGAEEINELHVKTQIPVNQLLGILLELELKGIIVQNQARCYRIREDLVIQKEKI